MINKLIVLGIDGMDIDVVHRYKEVLPNISRLMEQWDSPRLRSVFPADTTPAWATVFTGMDPSEHGIINFINMGDRKNSYNPLDFDDSVFKGCAFWDRLNMRGYSCVVLFPMNIKTGYEINGLMMTRPRDGKMFVYPKERRDFYAPDMSKLIINGQFTSDSALSKLRDAYFAMADEEIRITKLALEYEDADMLFSYFSTTDGIQHDFWRHCNPDHPNYPGSNEYENTIRDMYIKMDSFIGEVCHKYPNRKILVVSDHGHGARPVYTVRINELLRRGGYLTPKSGNADQQKHGLKRKFKKAVKKFCIGAVKRVGLPKWATKLLKKIPVWKSLFASSGDFDWDKTLAYLSDLSALKNYSYGGIRLTDVAADKDSLADEIIEYLKNVMIEGEDKPLFEWIVRTNTFYHGDHLDRYPEIIYQMDERYGGEWELGRDVFSKNGMMHAFSPGGHKWRTAFIGSRNIVLDRKNYEMTDIFKIIMNEMSMSE